MKPKKTLEKRYVLTAIEPTAGLSPEDALRLAVAEPERTVRRIFIRDYFDAFEVLTKKGFSAKGACDRLVALGAPFSPGAMRTKFDEIRREEFRSKANVRRT